MNDREGTLTKFELRLLAELRRTIVVDGPSPSSRPPAGNVRGFRRRRRLALAGGVAAVTVAAALAAGLPLIGWGGGGGPEAAYAVTSNDDGTVSVEIREIRDAQGLQRKLREAGVPAVVQYLPPGTACRGTFALVRPGPEGQAIEPNDDGSMRFELDTRSLQPGQTVLIYTLAPGSAGAHEPQPTTSIAIAIAPANVAACHVTSGSGGRP